MFGLFQADLPIGNRLWLALLALAIAGTLAATPLASISSTPVEFVTNLLSLYGQASFIELNPGKWTRKEGPPVRN